MKIVYLSLGSNIGDRQNALQAAIDRLHSKDFRITKVSSLFETAAVEYTTQADFLNCAVEAETDLLPMRLLQRVASIERELGRKRIISKGPRTIDIDILLHGRAVIDTPQLQIPHPQDDGTPLRAWNRWRRLRRISDTRFSGARFANC